LGHVASLARRTGIALLALAVSASHEEAHAQGCKLTQVASLPMTVDAEQRLVVPGRLNDRLSTTFAVDTGAFVSLLRRSVADRLGLAFKEIPERVFGVGGRPLTSRVLVTLQLDKLVSPNAPLLLMPDTLLEGSKIAGLVGADYLSNYDLDLDFGGGKLNLFSQGHCQGQVVYWSSDYLQQPIELDHNHHVFLPITLDGRQLKAVLDTGASDTFLPLPDARWQFGLDPNSPGMEPAGASTTADGSQLPTYRYRFKTMEIAGITFHNPTLSLIPRIERFATKTGSHTGAAEGELPQVTLGIHELAKLHLYIAYGEHMLYVTPADAGQP